LRAGLDARADDDVGRQRYLGLAELAREQLLRERHLIRLVERLADAEAGRRKDRVRDAAAEDQHVDLRRQRLEHLDLGRHLRPADDRGDRPLRLVERGRERLELRDEQRARARDRRVPRDAVRARLRAVRGAERVHDEDVTQLRHPLCERVVVLFLALLEAHVLAEHELAGLHVDAVEPARRERHFGSQQLAELRGDRGEGALRIRLAGLRPSQVRHHEHACARAERGTQRRERGVDPRRARDLAVFHGHVEILADQHALAAQVEIGHPFDGERHRLPFLLPGRAAVRPVAAF
jgi:hypothetical protein